MFDDNIKEADLDRLCQALFNLAKLRWGIGITIGVLAVLVAPTAFLLDFPRWIGLTVAATMSAVGFGLRWWSEYVRGDANKLLTANDLASVSHPLDRTLIANICAKYVRLVSKIPREKKEDRPYAEAVGDPSTELLIARLRESAWWTAQLASKVKMLICVPSCLAALAMLVSFVAADSMSLRTYAMSICAIILLDMAYLGSRYSRLSRGSERSFLRLSAMLDGARVSEREALIGASQYQLERDSGPLIPSWVWCRWRPSLNAAWGPLSRRTEVT